MASVISEARSIPLVEPWFPPEYAEAIRDQVLSGFIGPGPATQSFGRALAEYVHAAGCVLTVSGTVALSVAAKAIGLQANDEILVPAYGVVATINAFASIGLDPKLVDIDRETGCMSRERLDGAISPRTRAVCYVNFSGHTSAHLAEIAAACASRGIPLIEDAACALGHRHEGRAAGMFGAIGVYSFSVPKVITTGQGGALVSDDRRLLDKAAAFIDHGDLEWRKTNLNREVGSNLRLTDLQARLGLCQMRDLETRLERRRRSFTVLREALWPYLYQVPGDEAPLHNIVFAERPDELVAALRQRGIHAARQYRTLSQHPAYASLSGPYSNADYWTSHAVYLPFGMSLTPEDAGRVATAVHQSRMRLLPWPGDEHC
jgi:perosamine synthetase